MKCPRCKKDFEEGVKAAYKLGLLEGENHLKHTIGVVKTQQKYLIEELFRLDRIEPVAQGKAILLPIKSAVKIIGHLNGIVPWYAKKLAQLIKKQRPDLRILDDILKGNTKIDVTGSDNPDG